MTNTLANTGNKKPANGFQFLTQQHFIDAWSHKGSCPTGTCASKPKASGSISVHCPITEKHRNNDANASLVVWTDTGMDKLGRPITDGRAAMECKTCYSSPLRIISVTRQKLGMSPSYAG